MHKLQTHFTLAPCHFKSRLHISALPRASPRPQETTRLDSTGSTKAAQKCRGPLMSPEWPSTKRGARGQLITSPVPGASVDNSLCFSQCNQAPLAHSSDLYNSSHLGFPPSLYYHPSPWLLLPRIISHIKSAHNPCFRLCFSGSNHLYGRKGFPFSLNQSLLEGAHSMISEAAERPHSWGH